MKNFYKKKYIKKLFIIFILGLFLFPFSQNNKVMAIDIDLEGTMTGQILSDINGDGIKLDWENPNKDGDNPYRFRSENIIDSGLIMKVIGCTGVVDSISKELTMGVQNIGNDLIGLITGDNEVDIAKKNMLETSVSVTDKGTKDSMEDNKEENAKANLREQCLNGIAYTLAKNQLTDMTRYTLNWITSGFSGDPFYVRNMERFMTSLNEGIIKKEIEMFGDIPSYPYSTSFSRSYISTYKQRIKNFEDTMMSSMLHYLEEGKEVEDFADNFLVGGWDGFIAMTQFPQNNPLGYTMVMSQNIADKQTEKAEEIKQELNSSTPTLSQKVCVKKVLTKKSERNIEQWNKIKEDQQKINEEHNNNVRKFESARKGADLTNPETQQEIQKLEELVTLSLLKKQNIDKIASNTIPEEEYDCDEWEVVTPGKFITDKVSQTLNSPERQLELADTLNEALNMLFTKLITKLQNQGLTSLASDPSLFSNLNLAGEGNNAGLVLYNKSTGYSDSFDVLKSFGNLYYKSKEISKAGYWNPKNNTTSLDGKDKEGNENINNYTLDGLYKGFGPKFQYYEVVTDGPSQNLFDGDRGWSKGDRAFFDGKNWQRWDCKMTTEIINGESIDKCSEQGQKLPIKEKGVIQKQEEFIAISREVMSSYSPIMPKLGELDYCIPGPNPNWASNSLEAREAYINYIEGYHTEDIANIVIKTYSKFFEIQNIFFLGLPGSILENLGLGGTVDGTTLIIVPPEEKTPKYDFYKRVFTESNSNKIWEHLEGGTNRLMPIFGNPTFLDTISPDEQYIIALENKITNMKYLVRNLIGEYEQKVNEKYFDNITKKYLMFEDEDIENPAYLPMAKEGLSFTRKMISYNNGIKEAIEYYEDSISDSSQGISQLNIWRGEINNIIKAAQDRRRKKMKEDLGLTEEELDKKIAELTEAGCFENEELIFIDEYEIKNIKTERCDDGVDNDLDGLIDKDDPDCADYYRTNNPIDPNRRNID